MRLLITGGAGFIGSAVVRQALSAGHEVLNLDAMTYAASPDTLRDLASNERYRFVKGSISDATLLDRLLNVFEPDVVMNLAAESHVDRSIDSPAVFVKTNIAGTFSLLQAARRYWYQAGRPETFRFHQISTDEVFGTLGKEGRFDERTPYAPNSPYAASKASADHLVRAWGETYGLPVILTNCSNNYGPFQFPEKLIPKTIIHCLLGSQIPVYGKGENVRDWLFVGDHAQALLTVVEKAPAGAVYAIGGRAEVSNIEIVHAICAYMDEYRPAGAPHDRLIDFVTDRPGHDFRYAIDPSKIERELDWRASHTISAGLRETVEWYLSNRDWWQPLLGRAGERLGLGS